MREIALLFALVACDAPPKPAPAPAPEPPAPVTKLSTAITLQWSDVVQTDGCFFFSGPDGRDDRLQGTATLERDDTSIRLRVGAAEFEGSYRGGELALFRTSAHEYGGKWLAFETITGTYTENVMRAKYRYHECDSAGACPGRCEIRATLELLR
jgi:hypothetical protein